MASTSYPTQPVLGEVHWSLPGLLYRIFASVDHKILGLMYIIAMLLFFVISGCMAILMRIQLAVPNNHFVKPETFNQLFTMHGTTMVFLVGMPMVAGLGNYLALLSLFVPLTLLRT